MKATTKPFGSFFLLALLMTGCGGGDGGIGGAVPQPGALDPGGAGASLARVDDGQGNLVPANSSNAVDINDNNEVVGFAATAAGGNFTAARWTVNAAGQATVSPSPLRPLAGHDASAAFAIDSAGNAIGVSGKGPQQVAVLWKPGAAAPEALPALGSGGNSVASALSPNGRNIVGRAFDATTGTTRAVLWRVDANGTPSAPQVLPTNAFVKFTREGTLPVAFSEASGVNDAGRIVGEVEDGEGVLHAAVWEPGTGTSFTPVDLRGAGEKGSSAHSVDSSGRVVGESERQNGDPVPVLWEKAQGGYVRTELGASGVAADISATGRVAGWSKESGTGKATVWVLNGAQGSGQTILYTAESAASAINGSNLVVGRTGSSGFIKRVP